MGTSRFPRFVIFWTACALLFGCASMVAGGMAGGLSSAILNQDDPETVRAGAPAYLLLIDGMIREQPRDSALLLAGARLYGAYATLFVDDPDRARRMADRAYAYARRALCKSRASLCLDPAQPYALFIASLDKATVGDVPVLFAFASAWSSRIQARRDEWDSIADLPKLEAVMDRAVALDETHEGGQGHIYLGVLRSLRSPSLGGDPERGRRHFETAIELSQGRNLIAKVEFAHRYARLVFNRDLHDRLLREVLAADPTEPDLTLLNVLAQRRARGLLDEADAYF